MRAVHWKLPTTTILGSRYEASAVLVEHHAGVSVVLDDWNFRQIGIRTVVQLQQGADIPEKQGNC